MAQDVKMVLKVVDLHCSKCYKKVKKVLCKFPEITDQVYDEKANTVTIKVSCCNPEKLRDKICCKGGKSIKSIEIVKPKKDDTIKPEPVQVPVIRVQGYLPIHAYPMGCSCIDCRYGWPQCPPCPPPPPPPCYCGGRRCYCGSRYYYFCEENPASCTVM
ncbi:Heavy metal-associated domain, HMA [Dillenia turbinata]|uniref:Heavy metal-associated domain, HMA n=1 Tax=Dillenia turbinata TaxID=194707 RepID=A0AAN8ULQ4_9MAGN